MIVQELINAKLELYFIADSNFQKLKGNHKCKEQYSMVSFCFCSSNRDIKLRL